MVAAEHEENRRAECEARRPVGLNAGTEALAHLESERRVATVGVARRAQVGGLVYLGEGAAADLPTDSPATAQHGAPGQERRR